MEKLSEIEGICPYCKSEDLTSKVRIVTNENLEYDINCNNCKKVYIECYKVIFIGNFV